jgi:hypothetical protein
MKTGYAAAGVKAADATTSFGHLLSPFAEDNAVVKTL